MVTLCGWECNRRFGVALAMRHGLSGLQAQRAKKGKQTPCLGPFYGMAFLPSPTLGLMLG